MLTFAKKQKKKEVSCRFFFIILGNSFVQFPLLIDDLISDYTLLVPDMDCDGFFPKPNTYTSPS